MDYVWIDDPSDGGRIRCYGASSHPALLGTVGAWFVVVYIALMLSKEDRKVGIVGAVLSMAVVVFGNSGGPLSALMAGLVGWGCWMIRERMRLVRWGVLAAFGLLAIVMKQPIWYLPARMSLLFGGDGWHRSFLMDQFITHFSQWWFAGMPLGHTASWFPYLVMGAADITNLFVAFGVDGGLGAIALLIWVIVLAFKRVGAGMRALDTEKPANRNDELLMWAMGCGVMTHLMNYFAITYFDQTNFVWLFQLAAVSAASAAVAARAQGSVEVSPARNRSRVGARALARNPRQRRPATPSH
jgi:hypothetical protein